MRQDYLPPDPPLDVTDRIAALSPEKRALLELKLKRRIIDGQVSETISHRRTDTPVALSFAQLRLWFLDQFEPGSALYNMPYAIHVDGALDETVLKRALEAVVMRHESLRTTFVATDGVASQVIAQTLAIPLHRVEGIEPTRLEALLNEAAQRPFDLANGPLLRVTLFGLGAQEHVLLLVMHHVVSDGWSMGVLFKELSVLYEAFLAGGSSPLAELPIQYADYAAWQRERLQGEVLETQLGYWKKNLSDAPQMLELPTDHPRPALQSYRGARHTFLLPKPLAEALNRLARAHGCTLFMALLAAFYTLLYRYSGQHDMLIGTPIAGRNRTELEGLIGFFVNTLVLRGDVSGEPTFIELLARVRQTALDAYAHPDLPFEKLVEELHPSRDPGRSPLIQVMFALQNVPAQTLDLVGLTLARLALDIGITKFDLTLAIRERANGLEGVFEYSTDLFDPATIERMAAQFQLLLEGFVADPTRRISQSQFLSTLHDERNIDETHPETNGHAEYAVTNPSEQLNASRVNIFPTTPTQLGIWVECKLFPENPIYNSIRQFVFRGTLDASRLIRSLQSIVDRHHSLHTTFSEKNGALFQVVGPSHAISCPVDDVTELSPESKRSFFVKLIEKIGAAAFHLQRGPLVRFQLVKLEQEEHLLLVAMHHLVTDGPSWPVMLQELAQLYDGSELPSLPFQYGDFAVWQNKMLDTEQWEPHRKFWRAQVEGRLPLPGWPTDNEYHAIRGTQAKILQRTISRELLVKLESLRRQTETSLFRILLTAAYILFFRITGENDIVMGTTLTGRANKGTKYLIGLLNNHVALHSRLDANDRVLDVLDVVSRNLESAVRYEEYPFLHAIRNLIPGSAVVRGAITPFNFVKLPALRQLKMQGCLAESSRVYLNCAPYALTMYTRETPSGLEITTEYRSDLYSDTTIKQLIDRYEILLEGVVANPDECISRLPLLTQAERHQILVEWNNTATDFPKEATIPQLFEAQVERTPEAVAVVFEDQQLSYRQLNQRANHVATVLREFGVKPDTLVAIYAERSLEMVTGLLGILKAGGAYVPLDPSYPKERLAFMLQDTQAPVVLTQRWLVADMPSSRATMLCLDEIDWEADIGSQHNPATGITADNLAYVIYTSGSTGKPKGVMVSHRAICNHLFWMQRVFPLTAEDRVLQKTEISFDPSIWEFYAPLIAGARLIMAQPQGHRDSAYLVKAIAEYKVSVLQVVPAMMQFILQEPALHGCTSLRNIYCGGDVLSPELVAQVHQRLDADIINLYGPTEAAIDTLFWVCQRSYEGRSIPIGRPIDNAQVYILDSHLHPVPIGVPGELYVRGVGLARGYLNRPELTAEKFIPDPFSNEPGARLYKTSDRVRWLADSNIEFLGRSDHQIKLRGYRIELGEIESLLMQYPQVKNTVVLLREDSPGDKRLVAYVVAQDKLEASALRTFLKQKLPDYMIPLAFVLLDSLPLTPNGKVDRQRLPQPTVPIQSVDHGFVAPHSATEKTIASVWAEVLKLDRVGVHDDFFGLGGHSLLAMQVLYRIRSAFQIDLPLRALFEHTTVSTLAEYIDTLQWVASSEQHTVQEREQGNL